MPLSDALLGGLRDVTDDISASSTLPPTCYTDIEVLAAETSGLLANSWLGIGRGDHWANVGDYTAVELAGTSVIVLRDEQRCLRAFANTCRHRGTQLLAGNGNATRIQCPFHGWTYGLDGNLRGATRMGHAPEFRLEDMGLIEFRTAERAGFAFVTLNDRTTDIDSWLGAFEDLHAPWPLNDLVTTRRRELQVDCNWKLFLEVFNESYHLDHVHQSTFGGIYQEPDRPTTLATACSLASAPPKGPADSRRTSRSMLCR